jgi:hypothetical protein
MRAINSFFSCEELGNNLKYFSSLVIDTQGAELDVLKGMDNLITNFKLIKIETAEFDVYENYPKINILSEYLKKFGFLEIRRTEVDMNEYEILKQEYEIKLSEQNQEIQLKTEDRNTV